MRWKPDEQDLWCGGWASTRRKIHGIVLGEKLEPKERLGKLNCTLGRIKEEAEGAATAGVVNQNWPEVYTGMSLLIHRAWYGMPTHEWRLVMDIHYVWRELPIRFKQDHLGLTSTQYFHHLNRLKAYLLGYVTLHRDTEAGAYVMPKSSSYVRRFSPELCLYTKEATF